MISTLLPILLAVLPLIQSEATPTDEARTGEKPTNTQQLDGLWPSPKLLNLILARRADELCRHYQLDEEQRRRVRELVVDRWGGFLADNRSDIQPLANEFIEMRLGLEPPPKDMVQAWAKRTETLFDKIEAHVRESFREFREVLDDSQRPDFELDVLKAEAAMKLAMHKLKRWREGDVDPNDFWEPLPLDRPKGRQARHEEATRSDPGLAETKPKSEPADQIDRELDAWDKHVEQFIRSHGLDEGQRDAVLSCLSELKGRAADHRDRHRLDIAELERRIADCGGSEKKLADLKPRLVELYGPIDDMFKELESRIGQVLTAPQRARAAEARKQDAVPPREDGDHSNAGDNRTPGKGPTDK